MSSSSSSPPQSLGAKSSLSSTAPIAPTSDNVASATPWSLQNGRSMQPGEISPGSIPRGALSGGGIKRRSRQRQSGGFLLSGITSSLEHNGNRKERSSRQSSHDSEGKEARPTFESTGTEKKTLHIARSPLSNGAISVGNEVANEGNERQKESRQSIPAKNTSNEGVRFRSETFETDPAQIVNLALNLSENRRRHLSSGRIPSIDNVPNRRTVSTPQVGLEASQNPVVGSLKYHLNQQRRTSRTTSPKPDHTPSNVMHPTIPSLMQPGVSGFRAELLPNLDLGSLIDPSFNPSDATLFRAEKARIALELAYEHRRLLQYLPALPYCPECRPSTGKIANHQSSNKQPPLGRTYNPLQYIRNRKVRVRERKTLDSEADGWKDIISVRAWIDLVANKQKDWKSKANDEHSLPPFSGREDEIVSLHASPGWNGINSRKQLSKKANRPRTDWITNPWDFLGDHYWLSDKLNRILIEDRHRHKIYGTTTPHPSVVRPFSRRSASVSRLANTPEKTTPIKDNRQDSSPIERGRPYHQRYDSLRNIQGYSSSRERKRKWPHKLRRSHSTSSSDETDNEGKVRKFGQDVRTFQENRLLDRQIMAVISQDTSNWNWTDLHDFDEGNSTDTKPISKSTFDSSRRSIEAPEESRTSELRKKSPQYTISNPSGPRPHNKVFHGAASEDVIPDPTPTTPENKKAPSVGTRYSPLSDRVEQPTKVTLPPNRSEATEASKGRAHIQDIDFAVESADLVHKSHRPKDTLGYNIKSPLDSAMLFQKPEETSLKYKKRRMDSKQPRVLRELKEPEFRIRGLLKGARLADIVSSPVSKVGDLIWRKDAIDATDVEDSPSIASNQDLTSEPEEDSYKRTFSKNSPQISRQSSKEGPKYHIENLPTFRSPFKKDTDHSSYSDHDHISQQQDTIRQKKSRRFNKLAPPALDMRSISRSQSPSSDRNKDPSYSSDDAHQKGSGADRRFAVVGGSLASHGSRHHFRGQSVYNSTLSNAADTGFLNLDLEPRTNKITRGDVDRVAALIASTQIKAEGIVRHAISIREPPHQILQEYRKSSATSIGPVPHAQEFVIIAGLLVKSIDETHDAILSAIDTFNIETIASLHEHLRSLEEFITNKLTGMVRKAADNADDLGTQLATDYTMEVKKLNENIDMVLRRRRRRLRWVRRGGYLLLEWILLTLMWWVWLIVVGFKILRGTVRGVFRGVKWLLWLS